MNISDIKAKLDLYTEAVRLLGPAAQIGHGVARWRCPKHDERTPSFSVNLNGEHAGRWRCWGACGCGGDVLDFLAWMEGTSLSRIIERFGGVTLPPPSPGRPITRSLPRSVPSVAQPTQDIALPSIDSWVTSRGWEVEVAVTVGLHVVADRRGSPRVRFPFRRFDAAAEPIWQQDRTMSNDPVKWLSPRGQTPCPFEAWRMQIAREQRTLFICEGLPDVVALLHYWPDMPVIGIPGSSSFKPHWARAFRGLNQVVILADNDAAGLKLRSVATQVLDTVLWPKDIYHMRVPEEHNDVDAWRQACPDDFPDQFMSVLEATLERRHGRQREEVSGLDVGRTEPGGEGGEDASREVDLRRLDGDGDYGAGMGGGRLHTGGVVDLGGEAEDREVMDGVEHRRVHHSRPTRLRGTVR